MGIIRVGGFMGGLTGINRFIWDCDWDLNP